ncbi:DUF4236 domain-containing protein [Pseudomonas monteilii]|uniref:DUF4236 domain-containing protein n=1 Tax=Pseudomonas monteilii TaxID=76759 RepID=UPI001CBCDB14|nr:DUF4236 domain-containing protein [Pseudomonas monteilii]MBZ3664015.1 DUF4236 domain-containing protein [Pseudomonas monteilii]MBZ3669360.1 DUF4236 domain-containing protein [Pseudomonas monteilii]
MGLSFSRSISFGLVRFNFSEQGIGVSVVIPGLRAGIGMRGAYIRGGLGSFQYRRSIGSPAREITAPLNTAQSRSGSPMVEDSNVINTTEHEVKSVLELQDSTSDALLQSMNEQISKRPVWPLAAAGLLALFVLLLWGSSWPAAAYLVIFAALAAIAGWLFWRDQLGRLTVLFYEPDQATSALFDQLCTVLSEAANARKLRSIASTSRYADPKYSAGAGQGVQLGEARLVLGNAPGVVANVQVPILASKRTTLALYPDRILAFQENAVGSIDYVNFSAVSSGIRYVENNSLAADAAVVDKTWQYVNKKGGPDRRFKNNRELPVCAFSQLNLSTPDGLDMRFVGSRQWGFDGLAKVLSQLRTLGHPAGAALAELPESDWGTERANGLFKADV